MLIDAVHTKDHRKGRDLIAKNKTKTKPDKTKKTASVARGKKREGGRSRSSSPSQSKREEGALDKGEVGFLGEGGVFLSRKSGI